MATPAEIKAARDKYLEKLRGGAVTPTVSTPVPTVDRFPKQAESTQLGTDLYFQGKSGKTKEQAIAELQNDVNNAPDFATYAKLSRAIQDVDSAFTPGELVGWAGATPVKPQEMGVLGVTSAIPAPTRFPINAPSQKQTGVQATESALRPQIVVGPVAKEFERPSSVDRAKMLLSDDKFAEELKGKTVDEAAVLKDNLEASRSALAKIIDNLGPDASDADVIGQFKIEMDDLPKRLKGESSRVSAPTITIEPGKAVNPAVAIYARQTAAGTVPNLTSAQAAYLQKYYDTSAPRLRSEAENRLKQKFTAEPIVEATEEVRGPGAATSAKKTSRPRTQQEIDAAIAANMPAEIASLQAPWWTGEDRDAIIRNPEKFATGGGLFETKYPAGATKEGFGAYALRLAMSPINITTTILTSGAARGGEALGRAIFGDTGEPSSVTAARQKRGGLAAELPDDFVGDLADSVAYNRGAAQQVQDIYKELGLNENLGFGLGFALDMIAPPVGGLAASTVESGKAFSAARAAKAAGLIGAEEPVAAAAKAFGNTMRSAWTWRPIDAFPGSIKILGAEETGKALVLRDELRAAATAKGAALEENEIKDVVQKFSERNGGGSKLAQQIMSDPVKVTDEVTKDVGNIAEKGEYFSGGKNVVSRFEKIIDSIKNGTLDQIPSEQVRTILKNAAGRSDVALGVLEQAKTKDVNKLLTTVFNADPEAVTRAAAATVTFDAFNQVQKAKGFSEFPDLVLVTSRHISTPKMAAAAASDAVKTPIGEMLSGILRDVKSVAVVPATEKMLNINPQRAVQVVDVTAEQAQKIDSALSAYRRIGLITDSDAVYARSLLPQGKIPVQSLRSIAEANMDLVIAGKGAGFDVKGIKQAARDTSTMTGRLAVAREQTAQMRVFTPKEMRSTLDGVKLYAEALFKDGKQSMQILDVPPTTRIAVENFYNSVSQVDKKIGDLYKSLSEENVSLRYAYGLPTTGKLTNSQILTAMARGGNEKDTIDFINSVADLALAGYKDTASSVSSMWMNRSFFSTNNDTYLTHVGQQYVNRSKEVAVAAMRTGISDVNSVVMTLVNELKGIVAVESSTTAMFKLAEHAQIDDVSKLIGGALYTREVTLMKDATVSKLVADDAINDIELLLPPSTRGIPASVIRNGIEATAEFHGIVSIPTFGRIDDDGQKLLVMAAIDARKNGWIGTEGLVRAVAERQGYLPEDAVVISYYFNSLHPEITSKLSPHISAYYNAADQAIRRAELNGDSIADTVSHIIELNKPTRDLVTGRIVQDSIQKFFDRETFDPVLKAIAENIPKNKISAQRALLAADSVLKFIGNVRYNSFLYLRPNYHVSNVVSAPWILHVTLGVENAPRFTDAYTAVRTMSSGPVGALAGVLDTDVAFTDSIGRVFTYGDLRDLGAKSGMFKTEQQVLFSRGSLQQVIDDAKSMGAPSGVIDMIMSKGGFAADWANSTDNMWRQMSLNKALREGKPISVAQDIAKKSLFDFGTLTDAERAFASRFLIFYTFSRVAAENLVKNIGSTAGAARFIKQAAMTRDVSKLVYDMSGGEEYDVRRFYLNDKDLAKAQFITKKSDVGMSQFLNFSPAVPSLDSFMTIAGIMYSRGPMEAAFGTQTGLGQYFDPLIKEGIKSSLEEPEQVTRADKMRIMSPQHVALYVNTENLPLVGSIFGDLTPLEPTKETSSTYNDKEWQLTPEGFEMYSAVRRWASVAGLSSTYDYYGTTLPSGVQTPGKDKLLKAIGFGGKQVITPEQQEQAVLKKQAYDVAQVTKQREEEQQRSIGKELKPK